MVLLDRKNIIAMGAALLLVGGCATAEMGAVESEAAACSVENGPKVGRVTEDLLFGALDALTKGDVAPWIDMFTEDGVMEFPYAPSGYPPRLEGRAAIADYMKDYPETIALNTIEKHAVYYAQCVLVAEFSVSGTVLPAGRDYNMHYIGVITAEDGKIKKFRDYWNPLSALDAMGGLDELLEFTE